MDPTDEQPTMQVDGVARNTAYALVVQIVVSVFAAATTLFLARALGADGFGLLVLAQALGLVFFIVADLGISPATARFVAEHRGDKHATRIWVASALWLKIAVSLVVSVAVAICAGPIADAYGYPELTWPLRAVAIGLFGKGISALLGGTFVAQGRIAVNLRIVLASGLSEFATTVALVLLGAGVAGAAVGRATGSLIGATVALILAARFLGRSVLRPRTLDAVSTRVIARYAGILLVVDSTVLLFDQINAILIGAFLTTTAVGQFQAPLRLTTLLLYPGYAIASGVAPRVSRHATEAPRVDAFNASLRGITILQTVIVVFIVVWAAPIVQLLFGSEYAESSAVLRALAPFVFLSGFAPLVSLSANYLGDAARRVPIAVAALVIDIGLAAALVPVIGIVGGAIAASVGYMIYVPAHLMLCQRALHLDLRSFAASLIRCAIAGAVAAGVLWLVGTTTLSLEEWIVGASAAISTYVVVLIALGELRMRDVRLARRIWTGGTS